MEKTRKRLKVFEKITEGLHDSSPSRKVRMMEKIESWNFYQVVQLAYSFGDVQMFDFFGDGLVVSFFDLRAAKRFFDSFDGKILIQFEKCSEEDFVCIFNQDYFEILPLLRSCGEIMDVRRLGQSFYVYFFDIRAARAALFVVRKEEEISPESLEISSMSDSSLSPYLLTMSPSTSTENSFDESHFQTKTNFFKIYLDRVSSGKDQRTSLMIRNIPNKYTQVLLLELINKKFYQDYDFFYLPIDFRVKDIQNQCNVGYAFINFKDYLTVVRFFKEFNGKKWEKFNSEKICALNYARIQGKQELISHLQISAMITNAESFKAVFTL